MKKYAFMVYHKEYEIFLHTLRNLGVVHVKETKPVAGNAVLQELLAGRRRVKTVLNFFQQLNGGATEGLSPAQTLTKEEGLRLVEKVEHLQEKKAQLLADKQSLQKDMDYMQVWGEFSYVTIENLKEAGYIVSFFTCPTSRFDTQWVEDYNAFLVNNIQSVSYFVTVTKEGEPVEIEAERPKMPDRGLDVLRVACQQLEENIRNIDNRLKEMATSSFNTLEAFGNSLEDEYNFTNVVAQTERQADDKLMFLEGWTTARQAPQLEAELDKQGYFYRQQEVEEQDKVPIQLKNNWYARLFEPITTMFSIPNYKELDPTPLLAPFFMFFFGLCFGDAGYGLLVLLASTLLKSKVNPSMRPILSLAQWLGGTAVVVGLLITGTFFGVVLFEMEALSSIKDYFLTQDNLLMLAIYLGLFHVVFGKAVAAYKTKVQRGIKYSIAPWAWVFIIASLVVLLAPTLPTVFGFPALKFKLPQIGEYICYGIAAAGALVVLLYNSPGKSIFLNVGAALWGTYNTASGILGDTLSYIRLFAIGLTGGILGGVFNMLGVDMTAGLPLVIRIPVMLIILLIGHGLNIGLCTISSLVHPVRLIFVEYFKNSEFEGGGIAYAPFKKV